jgi:hypothetical protein
MIVEKLHEVEKAIEESRQKRTRADRNEPVQLVAVTKNHDVAAMREAIDAGVTVIGENRIQEARQKHATLEREVSWHLIGHLQTNKAKQAVEIFDLIHSVDSIHLARALDQAAEKHGKVQDILVQVNLAREESKSGVYEEALPMLLAAVDELTHLRLCGLMCIAPNYDNVEQCRPLFRRMYEIFEKLKEIPGRAANIKYLSMGMTHDYRIAIEEGANIVRVGTAIFGQRQY